MPTTFKASHKMKIEDIHDHNHKVSRGTGIIPNKKKVTNNFRQEKHKKALHSYMWCFLFSLK